MELLPPSFPENLAFPFKPDGTGGALQFSWKRFKWEPLIGSLGTLGKKKTPGYHTTTWTIRTEGHEVEGKRKFSKVHRIVWEVHNGPIPAGMEIDHIDMDKTNNHISNLRLVTHAENIRSARAIKGNWSPRKLQPHQLALTLAMPSNADWRFWANRWGVHKVTLLVHRVNHKKKSA